jgi:hypothetical protein
MRLTVGLFGASGLDPGQGIAGNGSAWGRGVTVLIGVIALIGALAMARRGVRVIRHRKLYLYTGGIVYTNPSGRAKWCAPWHEARVYWGAWYRPDFDGYRVVFFPQGGRVRFGVGNVASEEVLARGVGPQLRMLSTAAKLPAVLDRLHSGETVQFGPLTVDAHGVTHRAMTLPWPQVTAVTVLERATLIITATQKRSIRVPTKKIPDLSVLLNVTEDARSSSYRRTAWPPTRTSIVTESIDV